MSLAEEAERGNSVNKNTFFNILSQMVLTILSPVSPIVILVVGYWLNQFELNGLTDIFDTHFTLGCLVTWLIFSIVCTILEQENKEQKRKIDALNTANEEKARQLEVSSGIILHKYGDFAAFKHQQMFLEAMKIMVDNNQQINSAQLYTYTILPGGSNRQMRRIRVNGLIGYAKENVIVNNILQTYYSIKYWEQIQSIVDDWKLSVDDQRSTREQKRADNSFRNESMKLFSDIRNELRNKGKNTSYTLTEEDFGSYCILQLLYLMMLSGQYISMDAIQYLLSSDKDSTEDREVLEKFEEKIYTVKRTSILGNIILDNCFILGHGRKGSSTNSGRLYISIPLQVLKQNYFVLFVLNENLEYGKDMENICSKLENQFTELIEDFLNKKINKRYRILKIRDLTDD